MREIKFRAFHNPSSIMYEVDGDSLYIADGKLYEVREGTYAMMSTFEKTNVSGDYELMQFTGLLDNNGKEIYEGDIVKIWSVGKAVIEYSKGSFIARYGDKYLQYCSAFRVDEVIGNIYQNPGILK